MHSTGLHARRTLLRCITDGTMQARRVALEWLRGLGGRPIMPLRPGDGPWLLPPEMKRPLPPALLELRVCRGLLPTLGRGAGELEPAALGAAVSASAAVAAPRFMPGLLTQVLMCVGRVQASHAKPLDCARIQHVLGVLTCLWPGPTSFQRPIGVGLDSDERLNREGGL